MLRSRSIIQKAANIGAKMYLLIVGGSSKELGGVEAFIDRAKRALRAQTDHRIDSVLARTAYLNIRRLPDFFRGLRELFFYSRQKPDCVWIQYVNIFDLVYVLAAKLLGQRVLVTPHLGTEWKSQQNLVLKAASNRALSFADGLALISKTQEVELDLPKGLPRYAIRNFLPQSVLAFEPADRVEGREFRLFHAGRLSEGKGTFLFVDLCMRLRDDGIPFSARISGGASADVYARLEAMIASYALQDKVQVLGRISDDALVELMKQSNVLVHLSKIDSYPLIVLESIAHGAFPICMELAGARDMVETYAGHIVSKQNPIDDAAVFIRSHSPAELRDAAVVAGRRLRDDYSWDQCVRAVDTALRYCSQKSEMPAGKAINI